MITLAMTCVRVEPGIRREIKLTQLYISGPCTKLPYTEYLTTSFKLTLFDRFSLLVHKSCWIVLAVGKRIPKLTIVGTMGCSLRKNTSLEKDIFVFWHSDKLVFVSYHFYWLSTLHNYVRYFATKTTFLHFVKRCLFSFTYLS